jgi:diacylglycerol kinase (ATP)
MGEGEVWGDVLYCDGIPVKQSGQEGLEAMSTHRVLLIVNPLRSRSTGRQLARMETVLREYGLRFEVHVTEHRGHAVELARRAVSEGYDTVVAVGGDGTVNEVVNGVAGSPATLAALPLGANNDFLRSLGIWNWREACEVLAAGQVRPTDVGLAEYQDENGERRQRYYAVLGDVGFGSEVVRNTPHWLRHALGGGLGYIVSLYRTAVGGHGGSCPMKVWADGELRFDERLLLVEALNGSYGGGGLKVAPRARMDDGLLDVFLVREMGWFKIWTLFPSIFRGTHIEHAGGEYFQVREVAVETERPVSLSVDGEVLGTTPARFSVLPGALQVAWPGRECQGR